MEDKELNQLLFEKSGIRNCEINNHSWLMNELQFIKLRDVLIAKGKILYEDLNKQVYVATIKGGWFKLNSAVAALHLSDNMLQIAICADEGLFDQHTSEGVLHELEKSLEKYIRK